MTASGGEYRLLRCLAEMPFTDRRELAALAGMSRSAVHDGMERLQRRGMVSAIPHASEFTAATRRYFPTAAGLGWLAEAEKTGLDELLRQRPVSAHWQRLLLERLDAVAVIYRVAAALAEAYVPLDFFWYRSGPADAGVILP